jgi:hypothetical protein
MYAPYLQNNAYPCRRGGPSILAACLLKVEDAKVVLNSTHLTNCGAGMLMSPGSVLLNSGRSSCRGALTYGLRLDGAHM